MSTYETLLQEQIRNEFTASQQYVAVAVWYDEQDLPRLASHFYKQSLEERNHAMMMVQYLLDKDIRPQIPSVGEVESDFKTALEPLELALAQEITVTQQIETLARTARDESDYIGEQFMQWFLKEQVEEVSTMKTLVNVANRAGENLFHLEDFLAREVVGDAASDPTAPVAAGGTI
ncbi:ferritin [Kribbella pratensis]|jgi:ferritin|uniref:Ferritin n=1 Tax=Kribbella pratensis TaxID=2512112 RepID=A0A4R8CJ21_9ACTN|nr:ferritin [Kribbella pratensis]TDW76459.1 ferritin [Kribbella pratensis]